MKKMLPIVLCFLFLVTAAVSLSADSALPDASTADLSVIYTNSSAGITVPVSDGKAEGTLPDGTDFSAENLSEKAATIRIYPVQKEEKEVYDWVENSLAKELDAVILYHVTCYDADGNEIPNNGAKITVQAPKTDKSISVYSVTVDGTPTSLSSSHKDGKVSFEANGVNIYALCIIAKNPDTADGGAALFAVLAVVALASAIVFVKRRNSGVHL